MSGTAADAGRQARRAADSDWLERAARAGYVVNGVLHLLIGGIAAQVALGSGGGDADTGGALQALAGQPFGAVVLWLGVVGFAALGVLHLLQAADGGGLRKDGGAGERVKATAKGVTYLVLASSTFSVAQGGQEDSGEQSASFTADLLATPFGVALVVALGLGVMGIGAYHVVKGVKKTFLEDLRGTGGGAVGTTVVRLGQAGYVAKGVALGVVGILFVVAAVQSDPEEATGLDGALKTLAEQPFGTVLLLLVAAGIAAYGVYSFARAWYARL